MPEYDGKPKYNLVSAIMGEIYEKKKQEGKLVHTPFNQTLYQQGHVWYTNGYKLEEAPEMVRNNQNFVNGFNRAKRLEDIDKRLYVLGREYYNDGIEIDAIPEKFRNNPTVIRGYEEAKNTGRKK